MCIIRKSSQCYVFCLDSNELLHAQHYPAVPLPAVGTENAGLTAAHRPQGPQTPRRGTADGAKPPKKPLTPYMIFSKRVSTHVYLVLLCLIRIKALITDIFLTV